MKMRNIKMYDERRETKRVQKWYKEIQRISNTINIIRPLPYVEHNWTYITFTWCNHGADRLLVILFSSFFMACPCIVSVRLLSFFAWWDIINLRHLLYRLRCAMCTLSSPYQCRRTWPPRPCETVCVISSPSIMMISTSMESSHLPLHDKHNINL